ncbi:hypothetical protein FRB94_001607 [Tulasnella sp. JGI-2019a]|nr:hypothetical protein FRB94_001607 [Tulasnella sp. JGI-2019a]KAG8996073.1 hypothetical protein FRB93_000924 [Tulasnella sp. JGI-2019a]
MQERGILNAHSIRCRYFSLPGVFKERQVILLCRYSNSSPSRPHYLVYIMDANKRPSSNNNPTPQHSNVPASQPFYNAKMPRRYATTLNNHMQKRRVEFTTVTVPEGPHHQEIWTATITFTYALDAQDKVVPVPFFYVGQGSSKGAALTAASLLALQELGYEP